MGSTKVFALLETDFELYYASEQYSSKDITYSTETGSSAYRPRTFVTEAQAQEFLKKTKEHNPMFRALHWKIVQITSCTGGGTSPAASSGKRRGRAAADRASEDRTSAVLESEGADESQAPL